MVGRGLIRRAVATAIAAGAGFVAIVAFGAAVFYALSLVVPPLAAAAITALLFVRSAEGDDQEEDEPEGLGMRAVHLFKQRPILGAVAALAGGWIFLRNPALATMVAAAFAEKSHGTRRRR